LPAVELRLFGPPEAVVDHRPEHLDRKPLALLAYLAVTGQPAGRAAMAALLWPEALPNQALVNVRKAIWAVKAVLGTDALIVNRASGTLRLGTAVTVDAVTFESRLAAVRHHGCAADDDCVHCAALLAEAANLARGDFMAGFALPDSVEFDDWHLLQAERLRSALSLALDSLARQRAAAGDLDHALETVRRRLTLDPGHEPAHRVAMTLLASSGRRSEALRQYERCLAAVRDGLGAEVEPATVALRDAILAGEVSVHAPLPAGPTEVPLSERLVVLADHEPHGGQDGPTARSSRQAARHDVLAAVLDTTRRATFTAQVAREIATQSPVDLDAYFLARVAEWCGPQHRLDERFVALTVLLDRGEAAATRWTSRPPRYTDLANVLADSTEPAVVLLGPPGAGKTTMLRRLELAYAAEALQRHSQTVTYFESLAAYGADGSPASPRVWLDQRWSQRFPHLPPLRALMADGRVLLLLDGLNEMPHASAAGYRALVAKWRAFVVNRLTAVPGNRALFTCRSLDYSAPLSSTAARVPQARLEPLSDDQVREFLVAYAPDRAERLLAALARAGRREAFRTPYLLRLLAEGAGGEGGLDLAAVFTGFVRGALARELESGQVEVADPALVSDRDARQIVQRGPWRNAYELPERGALVPGLVELGWAMQSRVVGGEAAGVCLTPEAWRRALGERLAEPLLTAGRALGVLSEDVATDEVSFSHQLLQEYFAARRLATAADTHLLAVPWRTGGSMPGVAEALAQLAPSEALPPAPTTGWEEAAILAAAMSPSPDEFVRALADVNLPLAGRAAVESPSVSPATRAVLATALAERSRDPDADLRARIAAGLALGRLGDPRLTRALGPAGTYLIGPRATVPSGQASIGSDEPVEYLGSELTHHVPGHLITLPGFEIGRFAVTNAEYACFIASGGYEDGRWWDTELSRSWLRGENTADGHRQAVRYWWERFRDDPGLVDVQLQRGEFTEAHYDLWHRRLAMGPSELELHLGELYPDEVHREPRFWRDPLWNNPAQPVVGVSWIEARAYCRWLAAQSALDVRLPTEVEWEAAARGAASRRYGGGDDYDLEIGNTQDLRVRCTTPVGVFPAGDTPEGIADLTGNTWDWTLSLWGPDMRKPRFRYPYELADGREDVTAGFAVGRIVRGGSWVNGRITARAYYRGWEHPFDRTNLHGFRLLVADPGAR